MKLGLSINKLKFGKNKMSTEKFDPLAHPPGEIN